MHVESLHERAEWARYATCSSGQLENITYRLPSFNIHHTCTCTSSTMTARTSP